MKRCTIIILAVAAISSTASRATAQGQFIRAETGEQREWLVERLAGSVTTMATLRDIDDRLSRLDDRKISRLVDEQMAIDRVNQLPPAARVRHQAAVLDDVLGGQSRRGFRNRNYYGYATVPVIVPVEGAGELFGATQQTSDGRFAIVNAVPFTEQYGHMHSYNYRSGRYDRMLEQSARMNAPDLDRNGPSVRRADRGPQNRAQGFRRSESGPPQPIVRMWSDQLRASVQYEP